MSDLSATAGIALGDDDLGDWAGLHIEAAEDKSRKAVLAYEQFAYIRAVTTDKEYFEALRQDSPGLAAWWVYGTDAITATPLSNESDYAARAAKERAAAREIMLRQWAQGTSGIYRDPIPAITMRPAVALAAGSDAGATVLPVVGGLQDFEVGNEVVTFNNTSRMTTQFRPSADAVVIFLSRIVSAATRKPLAMRQTSPGVFELPEPGYGSLICNYATQRRLVSIGYEAFTGGTADFWTDAVKEQLARDTLLSGRYPDDKAPPVMLLITSARTNAQQAIKAPRAVSDLGTAMAAAAARSQVIAEKDGVTLTETGRVNVSKRITSSQNSSHYVDVDVATEIQMDGSDGKKWTLRFSGD